MTDTPKRKPGRPKGTTGIPQRATVAAHEQKAIAREVIRQHVTAHIPEIIRAQVENSLGISYLVIRDKNGTFVEATNAEQVKAALAAGDEAFRVYTRQPHQGSAAMLLAYAADKPVEPLEVSGKDGGPLDIVATLQSARTRLTQAKRG
jgi:hypothetical protein